MNPPQTPSATETANRNRIAELAEQLQSLRPRFKGYWRAYLVAFLLAVLALLQGGQFLLLYIGVLLVILTLHDLTIRRVDGQIDAVVEALRDLLNNDVDYDDDDDDNDA